MVVKLLFFLFISSSCCASSMSWSPTSWLKNLFFGKQYQATQAYKLQDYDQALADFHDLMNSDPYNPKYNYNVGDILYKQGKYSDAKQAFLRTIDHAKVGSKLAEQAHFNLGNCCYQLEEWEQAIDAYRQVLKLNPDNEQACHNLELGFYKIKEEEFENKQDQQEDKGQSKNKEKSAKDKSKSQEKQLGDKSQDKNKQDGSQSEQEQSQDEKSLQDQTQEKLSDQQKDGEKQNENKQSSEKSTQQDEQQMSDGQDDGQSMHEQDSDDKKPSKNNLQDASGEKQDADDDEMEEDDCATKGKKKPMRLCKS